MSEDVEKLLAELDKAHNLLMWIKDVSDKQLIIHQRLEHLATRNVSRVRHELNTLGYDFMNHEYGTSRYTQHVKASALNVDYTVMVSELSARLCKSTVRDFADIESENVYLRARNAQLEANLKELKRNDGC